MNEFWDYPSETGEFLWSKTDPRVDGSIHYKKVNLAKDAVWKRCFQTAEGMSPFYYYAPVTDDDLRKHKLRFPKAWKVT